MKRFTFMLIAVLMAAVSFAQKVEKKSALMAQPKMTSVQQNLVPTQKAKTGAVKFAQVPSAKKIKATKAPRRVASTAELAGDNFILASDYLAYNEELGGLEYAEPAAGGTPVSIEAVDEKTIAISGFTADATEKIVATVDVTEGTISIADGQKLSDSDYGTVVLRNYSGDNEGDPLTGVIEDGYIILDGIWADVLGDGTYAGYLWSGFYYSSLIAPANGTMTWVDNKSAENVAPLLILQSEAEPKYATVYNFANQMTAIDVTMKFDKTFVIESQFVVDGGSTQGQFYTFGLNDAGNSLIPLTGVGTDNTLTFDCNWTLYSSEGYWFGIQKPATIKLSSGQFYYPAELPDVAATPADPEILEVGPYDATKGYGYVVADIPLTDADGEEIREDRLYYQFYSDIAGDIQPITFTAALYKNLTEDLTEIPYTLNDGYDFDVYQAFKLIYLNYDYTNYDRIGVKSIYKGGGETNATEIQWYEMEKPGADGEFTFDFNAMDVATSSNGSTDGDINEAMTLTEESVTLTISPKAESSTTPNRFWSTSAGPQLRVYSGTLTLEVPEGSNIKGVIFNTTKWSADNTADVGELTVVDDDKQAAWTGEAQKVVFTIAGNSRIDNIVVTVAGGSTPDPEDPDEAIDPEGKTYTFEDGTMEGWKSIDADGDDYGWDVTTGQTAHNGSDYAVCSASYINDEGALTPDNYLVSPKVKLGSTFSFFAVAQDAGYPAEHFGVYVSTKTKAVGDFEKVQEWTMTAAPIRKVKMNASGSFRAPRRAQGNWYQYIIDMSAFEGQEGYVAIRHFDCTDNFYLLVDDITFGTPADPDPTPVPDELVVLPEGVTPTEYTLTASGETSEGSISIEDTKIVAFDGTDVYLQGLAYYFPDAYVKGTLNEEGQVVVPSGQYVGTDEYGNEYLVALDVDEDDNFIDAENIVFDYDKESGVLSLAEGTYYGESSKKDADGLWNYFDEAVYTPGALVLPDVVVAPEGMTTSTWYLSCKDGNNSSIRGRELQVGISGNELYVQGLCEYLPEAWVKGTIDMTNYTATFESGQFYGVYADEYKLFFVGYDPETEDIADVVCTADFEKGVITTDQYVLLNGKQNTISYYDYFYDVVITKTKPESGVEAPEDLVTETYLFKAMASEANVDEDEEGNPIAGEPEDYNIQVQVGFSGDDVFIGGISTDYPELWVKATKNADGKYVIPANQYMGTGEYSFWGYTFTYDYFFTAVDEEGNFQDVVLSYDAEKATFTTTQTLVLNGSDGDLDPYFTYTDVTITKLPDVAATPADPSIVGFKAINTSYPKVEFEIPAVDVNGTPILISKLYYQIFIEKNGEVSDLVLTTDLYDELEEDLTMIPYSFEDDWDIYAGGETVYLNQGSEEILSWSKIGVQSIYLGGGVMNKSNIVWYDIDAYKNEYETGINTALTAEGKVTYYDLQGRVADATAKGILIKQVRQADGKVLRVKVLR